MSNLLMNQGELERIDFFIFASHEHGTNPNLMELGWLKVLLRLFEESVHVVHRQEE